VALGGWSGLPVLACGIYRILANPLSVIDGEGSHAEPMSLVFCCRVGFYHFSLSAYFPAFSFL